MSCLVLAGKWMPQAKVDILAEKIFTACEHFAEIEPISLNETMLEECKRVAKSSYLRKNYRIRQLSEEGLYILPQSKILTVPTVIDNVVTMQNVGNYSVVSLISLCTTALKNPSLQMLLNQQRSNLIVKKETIAECSKICRNILDGSEGARLAGKLKVELYIDDAQLAPTNGIGIGKRQNHLFVYSSFVDLSYEYRTRIENIDIVLMAKRSLLKITKKNNEKAKPSNLPSISATAGRDPLSP